MPRWLVILLALVFTQGILLASIGPAWYGEDEVNHYGYIEALARNGKWYSFDDNLASITLDLNRQLLNYPQLREEYNKLILANTFEPYKNSSSIHQNATAYQPPLYYYLLAKLSQPFTTFNAVNSLYFLRYLNVMLGVGLTATVYLLGKKSGLSPTALITSTSFIAFLPLLRLISSSVTVQIWVFLLYSLIYLQLISFLNKPSSVKSFIIILGFMLAGLYSQQAFFAIPVWLSLIIIYEVVNKRLQLKTGVIYLFLILIVSSLAIPHYLQLHKEVQYVVSREQQIVNNLSLWEYLPSQFNRLKAEAVYHFWDMRRSFIPFHASANLTQIAALIFSTSLITAMVMPFLKHSHAQKNQTIKAPPGFNFASISLVILFILGHGWFDFFQLRYGEQQYFKARYLFPLLPIFALTLGSGWDQLVKSNKLAPALNLFAVIIFISMFGSATLWLTVYLNN